MIKKLYAYGAVNYKIDKSYERSYYIYMIFYQEIFRTNVFYTLRIIFFLYIYNIIYA